VQGWHSPKVSQNPFKVEGYTLMAAEIRKNAPDDRPPSAKHHRQGSRHTDGFILFERGA
jgi:hypothetical protein